MKINLFGVELEVRTQARAKHDGTGQHFRCNNLSRFKFAIGEWLSIRVHHWHTGDPEHLQHAHPWGFVTFVLSGGYDDVGEGRPVDRVRAPTVRYRPRTWRHAVCRALPHTWTLVITGRVVAKWRYWIHSKEVSEATWNDRPC